MSEESLRLDKWLWFARFFKTRSLATKMVQAGRVRVDGVLVSKPSRTISQGVVLTFPQANEVRVIKVIALGERRGPAVEAQTLYEDLTPPREPEAPAAPRVGPRPSRKERQERDKLLRGLDGSPLADDGSVD